MPVIGRRRIKVHVVARILGRTLKGSVASIGTRQNPTTDGPTAPSTTPDNPTVAPTTTEHPTVAPTTTDGPTAGPATTDSPTAGPATAGDPTAGPTTPDESTAATTTSGTGGHHGEGHGRCSDESRHHLVLASAGMTVFAGYMEEICYGYLECARAAGHADQPLFTRDALESRYEDTFMRVTGADHPLIEAAQAKVDLFREGFGRFRQHMLAGYAQKHCIDNNWMMQGAVKDSVLTMYVEAVLGENDAVYDWVNTHFKDLVFRSWNDGTLLAIFTWIDETFGDREKAETLGH